MSQKVMQQGAEAKIILNASKNFIIKDRIPKSYRVKELDDKIRKVRTKSEIRLMEKASEIISVPKPILSYEVTDYQIKMPYVKGKKLSDFLDKFPLKKQRQICKKIGESVAKLHQNEIIHGDLTTSNMILKDNEVYFIDFGLGFISNKPEDQAVDIHLFKEALEARHFKSWKNLFDEFLKGYAKYPKHKKILERMTEIEKRGRYRN